ncbi:hypothetical protein DAPPUDRAFT_245787 [Daphnia pulex]|uniref:Uncharacterized protein n=1 Tax=Daphnia pulex TaxID=6669 RepID=E9GP25_DAPPU|nr:hypothetical protein DAPPUDRAFT_245787 [Daphnia pulex]|eukprot:EFX78757.1 hypothetical protein DAPPUDRAFT_245787 [Daphnia pulex]
MIVNEYPQIKEDITTENPSGYRCLKDDIYNSTRNMRSYRSRKEKRFENTIVPTAGSSRQSANPTSLMNEIVSTVPHYATFDSTCLHQVVAEFLMMPVMKNYDYGVFSTLFNKLVITFLEYLNKTHSTVPHYTEQFSTLDVLEAINKEASTGRGQPKSPSTLSNNAITTRLVHYATVTHIANEHHHCSHTGGSTPPSPTRISRKDNPPGSQSYKLQAAKQKAKRKEKKRARAEHPPHRHHACSRGHRPTITSRRPQSHPEERISSDESLTPPPEQPSQHRRATNNCVRGHHFHRRGHLPDTTNNCPRPAPSPVSRRSSGAPHTLRREHQQPPTAADAVHTLVTLYTSNHHECVLHCSRRG